MNHYRIHEIKLANNALLTAATTEEALKAGATQADIDMAINLQIAAEATKNMDIIVDNVYTRNASRTARYQQKLVEAEKYIAANYPTTVTAANYPYLIAETKARGVTKKALADLIVAKATAFNAFGASSEAARATLTTAISAATTIADKQAAAQTLVDSVLAASKNV